MYFIAKDNKKEGPLSLNEVLNLKLTEDIMVWKEGMTDWIQITDLPEFQKFIVKIPPPLPYEIRDRERKELKAERVVYASKQIFRNALIGLLLAILLDLIFTAYAKTGGTNANPIFLTDEKRENPLIIFWGLFPYCLLIGESLLLLITIIQVIIFRPQFPLTNESKSSNTGDFDHYLYSRQKKNRHVSYGTSEQTRNFLLGIGITIAIILILWLFDAL